MVDTEQKRHFGILFHERYSQNIIFLVKNRSKIRANRSLQVTGFVALFNGANYLNRARSKVSFLQKFAMLCYEALRYKLRSKLFMLKLIAAILLLTTLGGYPYAHANGAVDPAEDSGLNSYLLRGDIAAYEEAERLFIQAARNSQDEDLYKLVSPLTKRDSSEREMKVFIASMKEYFSDYASDMKCKSVVPKNDEYGNVGFLFFNAFKKSNGTGRAYVIALIKENNTVYVATVFRKFDEKYHARCRSKL